MSELKETLPTGKAAHCSPRGHKIPLKDLFVAYW